MYKEGGTTKAIQLSKGNLYSLCIESDVPADKASLETILDFYNTRLFTDQLKGMFAETIVLVKGATEFFTLPVYLKRIGFSLAEHGVEIVNCRGKDSIVPCDIKTWKSKGYSTTL